MARDHLEIERKYEAAASLALPDLTGVDGVAAVDGPRTQRLEAVYFDTTDLRLAARGITLRRRTGGDDAGWHLKLPAPGGDREEITAPAGRSTRTPPKRLTALVTAAVRGAPLAPVARISTSRTVHRLTGDGGTVLAEIADDAVTGEALPAGDEPLHALAWRELEVELDAGDRGLLDAVDAVLRGAGATAAPTANKLARVLDDRLPARAEPATGKAARQGEAAGPVLAHVAEQVDALVTYDSRVRLDLYDSVHKMRVATRRLRSALATYRPVLDRAATDPVRAELKWLGEVLGKARDAEVMRDRLRAAVEHEPPDLVVGPVLRRIDTTMSGRYRDAHRAVIAELDGERYRALLDALQGLVATPPLTDTAHEPADEVLPRCARRAYRRVVRAVADVEAAPDHEAREHALHEVRKAAKRARYAGESLTPAFGSDAATFASRMEDVQELLGEHQDSVVTRATLRDLGMAASLAGENGFTFGRLHALEQCHAERIEQDWPAVWRESSRKTYRRWLR